MGFQVIEVIVIVSYSQNHWVSGLFPTSGILNDYVHWLKLALSKGPNRVGVSIPSPEDGNIQFPNRCIFSYLEFRTMDKVQKCSTGCYTPSSGPFRLYGKNNFNKLICYKTEVSYNIIP
jgi:hypothetical protein